MRVTETAPRLASQQNTPRRPFFLVSLPAALVDNDIHENYQRRTLPALK